MATNRATRRAAPKKSKQASKQATVRVVIEGKPYEAPVFMRPWLMKAAKEYRKLREEGYTKAFTEFLEAKAQEPENAAAIAKQQAAFS